MRLKTLRIFSMFTLILFLSACASSSRYISSPSAPPPDLGLSCQDSDLSVTLNYLILPDGPGSWVKGARWDEYVLTVRNLCEKTLTVEKLRLIDPRGLYIDSGIDPKQLEKMSEAMMKEYKDVGIMVAIGAAPSVVAGAAVAAGAFGTAMSAAVLAPVALVGAPIYYFGKKHADQKDREAVESEFTRRKLSCPMSLSGAATIEGSVFYPIIPNPKALVIDYRIGNEMKVLEVSLDKLKGLHVASSEEATTKKSK